MEISAFAVVGWWTATAVGGGYAAVGGGKSGQKSEDEELKSGRCFLDGKTCLEFMNGKHYFDVFQNPF